MEKNCLAIIIPFFKLTFFRETLESLANQTDKRFKVYIGDDASPENPAELLKDYEGRFEFVYKRFDENLGGISLTKQWERCIEMMEGEEWFMILGDDDYMSKDAIEGFHKTNQSIDSNINVLRFNFFRYNQRTNASSEIYRYDDEETTNFISKRANWLVSSSLSEYIFRKKSYLKYGIRNYPKAFYSDNWMVLRYSDFRKLRNIIFGEIYVRISELSITGNNKNGQELNDAGYLFYTDLLNEYSKHFTKTQNQNFIQFLIDGYLLNITNLDFYSISKILYRNSGLNNLISFYFLLLKTRVYKFSLIFKKQ